MIENDFILADRIEVIRQTILMHGINKFYVSFSGGKDSTIVHHLIDEALPNNNIPRVYINTGIEYVDMVKFVQSLAEKDERIHIVNAGVNIKQMLDQYGYPFKSKEFAKNVYTHQNHPWSKTVIKYLNGSSRRFQCPAKLRYIFENQMPFKISHLCCQKLKKDAVKRWTKESGKSVPILGLRMEEGGARSYRPHCITYSAKGDIQYFKPINPCTDEWCDWYIKSRQIELCKLYYPPFTFTRTGCKGCPFAIDLQHELDVMRELLPNEYSQCELIWKPVYEEYRRIGYRLRKYSQQILF